MNNKIWISAGELSGDMHGAKLAKALLKIAPDVELIGMGGEAMEEAGVKTSFHIRELSVMGATEVLSKLPSILKLIGQIKKKLEKERPKALVVIDAPDFHFRIIKAAKKLNIPVYYYISPKAWAWRSGRANFIKNNVHRLISILPFEVDFYKKYGLDIDYVGNPLVEVVDYEAIKNISPQAGKIGILPGSRKKEISSLMPEFGQAAKILKSKYPELQFECIKAPNMKDDFVLSFWPKEVPLEIKVPVNRWEAMRQCEFIIAASGTVSMESAIAGVPTLVCYKLSKLSYQLGKLLVKVPYISLPNLILHKEVFPELIQDDCDAIPLAEKALSWLDPENKKTIFSEMALDLDRLRSKLGPKGAVDRAALLILEKN